MIWLHLCMFLSGFSTQLFAARDGSMNQVYETQIFENDALDIDLKEMPVLHWETSLNLHWKRRRWNTIQGYNWKVRRSCDDNSFMKFDMLEIQSMTVNTERYIRDQRIWMPRRCDEKFMCKFDKIVHDMDLNVRDSVNQIGRHFILPKADDILTCRYNPDEFLTQSIYKFLADESSKTADKQHIGWGKFDDLYKTHVLDTCQSLTLAIDEMARFRVRNYLKSRTLGYCEEFSKRWTVNSKICDNTLIDDGKIAKFVYQLVLKQNEQPTAQSCKNRDEIQD